MASQKKSQSIEVETLYKISQIAAKAHGLDDLWDPLFSEILKIMRVDAGTLLVAEEQKLVRKVARGLDPKIMEEPPIPFGEGISGRVAREQKPQIHKDLSKVEIASAVVGRREFHSLITVPMITRGQLVGVMSIFTKKERKFSKDDLSLFSTIANQAAMAITSIENTKILEENTVQIRKLTALNEIAKTVSHFTKFEEIHYTISGIIAGLFRAEKCFFLLNEEEKLVAQKPAFGVEDSQIEKIGFDLKNDALIANKVYFGGKGMVEGSYKQERDQFFPKEFDQVHSLMLAPLRFKNQTLGVIVIASSQKDRFYTKDLEFLSTLASQVAGIISSALAFAAMDKAKNQDEAILESITEGVYAIDEEGRYILFNKTAELISGYDANEILGKDSGEKLKFFKADKTEIVENGCPAAIALKKNRTFVEKNAYLKNKINQDVPVTFTSTPIRNQNNEVIGGLVVFRDISNELEIKRMKKELVSIASHELKAPVTAMRGYLEMLISGDLGKVKGEVKETLEDVLEIDKRLINLVEDLLDVSRIEQGRIKLEIKAIDLVEVVLTIYNEFSNQARQKGVKLKLDFDQKKKILVLADFNKLHEILTNLVSNAIKFTIEGNVTITISELASRVNVEIKDTGIGMTPEQQEHLFEKFFRAKDPQTKEESGTGLGLYIVKKLVNMMSGELWVKSVKGKGSTFGFSLPKAK